MGEPSTKCSITVSVSAGELQSPRERAPLLTVVVLHTESQPADQVKCCPATFVTLLTVFGSGGGTELKTCSVHKYSTPPTQMLSKKEPPKLVWEGKHSILSKFTLSTKHQNISISMKRGVFLR